MTSYRLRAYLYLVVVAIIWGAASPVIKFTLQGISPLSFLAYRFSISAIIGIFALSFSKSSFKNIINNFGLVFLYSILATTVSLGLLFLGLNKTTVLDTVLITAISPLVIAFFGSQFLNETITKREKLGMLLAFIGTAITILEPVFKGEANLLQLGGNFLVFGYLISNGLSSVLSKKAVRKDVKPADLSNASFIIGFLTILPLIPYEASFGNVIQTIKQLEIPFHLGVLYMAIFSGTIAYAFWIKGQKSIEISEAGVFSYLMPIFATPLAVFWLKEQITLFFLIGAALIATGVFVAELKTKST
jgi:drug/metabolite transporter (DMT)-like permease